MPDLRREYSAHVECVRLNGDVEVKKVTKWTGAKWPDAVRRALLRTAITRFNPLQGESVTLRSYVLDDEI